MAGVRVSVSLGVSQQHMQAANHDVSILCIPHSSYKERHHGPAMSKDRIAVLKQVAQQNPSRQVESYQHNVGRKSLKVEVTYADADKYPFGPTNNSSATGHQH